MRQAVVREAVEKAVREQMEAEFATQLATLEAMFESEVGSVQAQVRCCPHAQRIT